MSSRQIKWLRQQLEKGKKKQEEEAEEEKEEEPSEDIKLLTEIRDLLKKEEEK